eukprot:scaffold133723_cov17-Tisochrysis_lutea.AAC.3
MGMQGAMHREQKGSALSLTRGLPAWPTVPLEGSQSRTQLGLCNVMRRESEARGRCKKPTLFWTPSREESNQVGTNGVVLYPCAVVHLSSSASRFCRIASCQPLRGHCHSQL